VVEWVNLCVIGVGVMVWLVLNFVGVGVGDFCLYGMWFVFFGDCWYDVCVYVCEGLGTGDEIVGLVVI